MNAVTAPELILQHADGGIVATARGPWITASAPDLEQAVAAAAARVAGTPSLHLDLSRVEKLDTVGAVLLGRLLRAAESDRSDVSLGGATREQVTLIEAARATKAPDAVRHAGGPLDLLEDIGKGVVGFGADIKASTGILGAIVAGIGGVIARPSTFRFTSVVYHLDYVGLRALPIIALITFVVGAIVAQQSIFQLRSFGAEIFVVDLIGILTLRELGVLLTAIMVAGRSGSAFTAEIGSMKMREEIDALRVMALDPVTVLVVPRLLALIIGLPLLAFLANLFSMAGGGIVAWIYGGISPEIFLTRLKESLTLYSFGVGLLKAPFMGLVIGVIAVVEGLRVQGSAESLGQRTTASVVKAIFAVIVLDGIFAIFFAAIGW